MLASGTILDDALPIPIVWALVVEIVVIILAVASVGIAKG
jgi:hypothetical protein